MDTDQEEFESRLFVSCGSSSAALPAPALATVRKEEAFPGANASKLKTLPPMTQDSARMWLLGTGIPLNANLENSLEFQRTNTKPFS